MTIKEKVFKFNFILLMVFLAVVLIINGILILVFKEINTQKLNNELPLDKNIRKVYDLLNNLDKIDNDWNKLSQLLEQYEYHLYVEQNEKIIYNNLNSEEVEKIYSIQHGNINIDEVTLYHIRNSSIGRIDLKGFKIIVINKDGEHSHKENSLFGFEIEIDQFLMTFLLIGLIVVIIIFVINQLMTKRFVEYIMKPIDALLEGVKRIEKEDYSTAISYNGDSQFEKVCETFNELQIHLKEEKEKNQKYEKSRRDMIAGISHDLRTPLTSVKGYIKGIMDGVAIDKEKQKKYLSIAYKKSNEIEILLEKLFYFSKLETGNMPFHFSVKDLGIFMFVMEE